MKIDPNRFEKNAPDYHRLDNIDLRNINGQIEIWDSGAIMDGGTLILCCRYDGKLFQISTKQHTIKHNAQIKKFLHLNENVIPIQSEEEDTILRLLRESKNVADNLRFLPKFLRKILWSKRNLAYWIEDCKDEVLRFADSKEYKEYLKLVER